MAGSLPSQEDAEPLHKYVGQPEHGDEETHESSQAHRHQTKGFDAFHMTEADSTHKDHKQVVDKEPVEEKVVEASPEGPPHMNLKLRIPKEIE